VVRPHQDFRGFAGRVASGTLQPGEEIVVLPSGRRTHVRTVESADGPLAECVAGDSVVLTTEDEIDISRGEMIVRTRNLPTVSTRFEAIVSWMHDEPMRPGTDYMLLHTTRQVRAVVRQLVYRINVDTLHREETEQLGLNDIGRVQVETAQPLFYDPYRSNRQTGGFILVDPHTNATVGAGMIRGEVRTPPAEPGVRPASPDVVWEEWNVPRREREARHGHPPAVVWFTGLSGAGKSTVARLVERRLFERGFSTMYLDGDQVRHGLCGDLGFSAEDRRENIRRVGEVARLFYEHGDVVLCAFVSPYRGDRDRVRKLFPEGSFLEVHVAAGLAELRRRDPKGLYARADAGEIRGLTGVDAPYEVPERPALVVDTESLTPEAAADRVLEVLAEAGIVRAGPPPAS
jgi:bifunctional enzyme CysN/CysC